MQFMHAFGNLLHAHAEFLRQGSLGGMIVRQEFVQRRVEESNGRRQAFQFAEHPGEVFPLIRQQFRERFPPVVGLLGENHLAHRVDTVTLEEHVLRAAEADARGPERDGVGGLFRIVRIGADLQPRSLVAPFHQLLEVSVDSAVFGRQTFLQQHLNDLARSGFELAQVNVAAGAVDREIITFVASQWTDGQCPGLIIHLQLAGAAHANFPHLPRHKRRVRTDTAARGEDAFGGNHSAQVFRRCLHADQEDFFADVGGFDCPFGIEIDPAAGRARTGRQT